jgi:hypothetical protein
MVSPHSPGVLGLTRHVTLCSLCLGAALTNDALLLASASVFSSGHERFHSFRLADQPRGSRGRLFEYRAIFVHLNIEFGETGFKPTNVVFRPHQLSSASRPAPESSSAVPAATHPRRNRLNPDPRWLGSWSRALRKRAEGRVTLYSAVPPTSCSHRYPFDVTSLHSFSLPAFVCFILFLSELL